jgi:signal transduction histidine kinase
VVSTLVAARPDWRAWLPDVVAGTVVLVLGLVEAANTDVLLGSRAGFVWAALTTALAVGLSRQLPGVALAVVWAEFGLQLAHDAPLLYVQAAVAAVAFGTARWGRVPTVVLSALSIPAAGTLAVFATDFHTYSAIVDAGQVRRLLDLVYQFSATWQVAAAVFGTAVLGVPWLTGLTLRFNSRAMASRSSQEVAEREAARAQSESEQAREIARLQEGQAQLARDVHDVVGHSLAVILAQAESAQFVDDVDTAALRLSMRNIADSARESLQNVRHVLTPTDAPPTGPGELRDLVDGVRASGHEVALTQTGAPRPLPPDLATVAYRVLQEMLTNAIRHGSREQPATVALHWATELRIEVANPVGVPDAPGGQGIDGMRRRLESVGGRLDVRRSTDAGRQTFTATAWVPTRTVAP